MNWKENIRHWRGLSPAQQQQFSLARSPMQVWQSMAFERQPVSLLWLQAQHVRLLAPHRPSEIDLPWPGKAEVAQVSREILAAGSTPEN